jgi:ABC-type nickel/cobalt efflux system permease component RcnA
VNPWLAGIIGYLIATLGSWMLHRDQTRALEKERDTWRDLTHRHEQLAKDHEITLEKFKALACGHAPHKPYQELTPEIERHLLTERLAELEARLS